LNLINTEYQEVIDILTFSELPTKQFVCD